MARNVYVVKGAEPESRQQTITLPVDFALAFMEAHDLDVKSDSTEEDTEGRGTQAEPDTPKG